MMEAPLVTVICLCFNHSRFVKESIASIFSQTYSRIQVIVIDDASTDDSVQLIREVLVEHPEITFIGLAENLGNCKAFNKGLAMSQGDFIIDLAADDVLLPRRIESGIAEFGSRDVNFGVNFSDAELIDVAGRHRGYHSDRFPHGSIPQGDIYCDVISRYFICSPTMMIRRTVLKKLGGYDESLAYEDFDFWIRSSREFNYCYTPEPLVRKRIVTDSMSKSQYKRRSIQLVSTLRVCEKIMTLNRNDVERKALRNRAIYELRRAALLGELKVVAGYVKILLRKGD